MEKFHIDVTAGPILKHILSFALFGFGMSVLLFYSTLHILQSLLTIFNNNLTTGLLLLIGLFLIPVIHESIHYLCHLLISGVPHEQLIFSLCPPFVRCKTKVTVMSYRINLLMPGVMLGLLPLLMGVSLDNLSLIIIGAVGLSGASADWIVLVKLLRFSGHIPCLDLEGKPGCRVLLEQ